MLDDEAKATLLRLADADGSSFTELTRIAELDPSRDFRGADLRNVDFGTSDLSGFDFSDADLTGARLNRARIDRTIFARAKGASIIREAVGSTRRPVPASSPLTIVQETVSALLFHRLTTQPTARAAVAMPSQSGVSRILEEVIARLYRLKELRHAIIIMPTAGERDQLVYRLRQQFPEQRIERARMPRSDLFSATIVVETQAMLSRLLQNRDHSSSDFMPGHTSHVFVVGLQPARVKEVERLNLVMGKAAVVVFLTAPIDIIYPATALKRLDKIFGLPLFDYTVEQALRDEILSNSEIIIPENQPLLPSLNSVYSDPSDENLKLILDSAGGILEHLFPEAIDHVTGVYILPEIEAVERTALIINTRSVVDDEQGINPRSVPVTTSGPDRAMLDALLRIPGRSVAMTPAMAANVDWALPHYVVVAVPLKPQLAQAIAYPPNRPDRLRVIDYSGTFDPKPMSGSW